MVGEADLLLSLLGGLAEGGRCELGGVRCPRRKGSFVGKSAVSGRFSSVFGEIDRPGVKHGTGDGFTAGAVGPRHGRGWWG